MTTPEPAEAMRDASVVIADSAAPELPSASRITTGFPVALSAALAGLGCKTVTASNGECTCRLPGRRGQADIALTPTWFSIGWPMRAPRRSGAAQSLLSRNARLVGGARLIIDGGQGRLLTECPAEVIPWENEAALGALLATLLASLGAKPRLNGAHLAVVPSKDQLDALFSEAGWPLRSAEDGALEVPLEVPGHYLTATVAAGPTDIRLHLPILVGEFASAPARCRTAVMHLFWLAVGGVRWVRPSLRRGQLVIEVNIPGSLAQAATFAHACAALSVAAAQFVEEASLLLVDQELARLYLSQSDFKGVS